MSRIPHWTLLAVLGLALTFAGCVYNDDDEGDDDGLVDDGEDEDDSGQVSGSGEARGSPGWGLMGSMGALLAGVILLRRKK